MNISIIICCYNSALRLPQTLKHLSVQNISDKRECEIIVVDNMSTDGTADLAQKLWKEYKSHIPLKIVKEKKPGLIYARDKGVRESKFEFLLFCDDDNWLSPNYARLAADLMLKMPRIGVIGGFGEAICEGKLPCWFKQFQDNYAVGPQASGSGDITKTKGYVFGAGMIVRKSALLELKKSGIESILTGRRGNKLTAGDDNEICQMLRLLGWKIWYDEKLKFKHWLPAERLEWSYLVKINQGFAKANTFLNCYCYVLECSISELKPEKFIQEQIKENIIYLLKRIKVLLVVFYRGVGEGDRGHLRVYRSFYMLLNLISYNGLHLKLINNLGQIKRAR